MVLDIDSFKTSGPIQGSTPFTHGPVTLPKGHQVGMRVPKGGSMCANCRFLAKDRKNCTEPNFVRWNKSPLIPGPVDEYCSDFYMPRTK